MYYRYLKSLKYNILNTKEFIHALAERLQVSQKEAGRLLDEATLVIRETLAGEEQLSWQKLGNFRVKTVKSRIAYIPALGRKALVPPHRTIHFQPSKYLKDKLKKKGQP